MRQPKLRAPLWTWLLGWRRGSRSTTQRERKLKAEETPTTGRPALLPSYINVRVCHVSMTQFLLNCSQDVSTGPSPLFLKRKGMEFIGAHSQAQWLCSCSPHHCEKTQGLSKSSWAPGGVSPVKTVFSCPSSCGELFSLKMLEGSCEVSARRDLEIICPLKEIVDRKGNEAQNRL